MRFTPELEKLISRAIQQATESHHEFVTLEHVLFSGMQDPEVLDILEGCGADPKSLQTKLKAFIDKNIPVVESSNLPTSQEEAWKPSLTVAFHRVVQRAVLQVESAGKDLVTSGNQVLFIKGL